MQRPSMQLAAASLLRRTVAASVLRRAACCIPTLRSTSLIRPLRTVASTMAIPSIDIGVNLTDPMFRGIYRDKQAHPDDLHLVLERARTAGVEKIIVTGTNLQDSGEALELVRGYDSLYCTVGCHPTRCLEFEQDATTNKSPDAYLQALLDIIEQDAQQAPTQRKVVAIGECGLDYDREHFCPRDVQVKYFERQFELAERTRLPMFLHDRNTGGDFLDMIAKNRHRFTTGVVHSFTGTIEEALAYIQQGLYIGLNGCSLKTEENLAVVRQIPIEAIMIETDCPWCDVRPTHAGWKYLQEAKLTDDKAKKKEKFELGVPVKGRNEPQNIRQVACIIARLHDLAVEEFCRRVYETTAKVFFGEQGN
ncbi:deoxyribonuclease TATDN1 [Polychytrium aggregatum]|uniref:deoxyribonuclease TATDN1 n=1 Tax=Polychytrium aggregatum TaxID=110093 RepID=UPI0022FE63AD|nr:deoxyribonuclease TATDN1 [Polychytrium aggregatum]KAI9207036.1 deoxyribonuclease TATDN1 [Polychytrium aggregatum]